MMTIYNGKNDEEKVELVRGISIHRALSELKLLDKRIEKLMGLRVGDSLGTLGFIAVKLKETDLDLTEIEKEMKSKLASLQKLIENRSKLKAAIEASNAIRKVRVAGMEITITEALTIKNHTLNTKKTLLAALKNAHTKANNEVVVFNDSVKREAERYASETYKNVSNINPEKLKEVKEQYEAPRLKEIFDPNGLAGVIEKLEKEIEDFSNEIDYILSEANANNTIEFDI